MAYGMGDYFVDIVMCIDATGSMGPILKQVKENALNFYNQFADAMEENQKSVEQLRVKIIAFRDFGADFAAPLMESEFFNLPEEAEALRDFVGSIKAKGGGGDGPESALEALALALKSDWTQGGSKRRHAVIMFTDAEALPLDRHRDKEGYPEGMPESLPELGSWWEGTCQIDSSFQYSAGRLVAFVPRVYPWVEMQAWNRYWPAFSKAGKGLSDVDLQSAIDLLVGSF